MKTRTKISTETMVLSALMTALVVVLQLLGAFIRFGTFSVSLVLIPIVIGAATCGVAIGAWLGLIFGVTVLLSGDAALFLGISIPGTIITVLLKGILCGLLAGLTYKALAKFNKYAAVIAAAIVCPIVNTGVFLLGCLVFFMDWIKASAGDGSVVSFMILALVGGNFLFELGSNIVLSPAVTTLVDIGKKRFKR